jgi:hypothetical protein
MRLLGTRLAANGVRVETAPAQVWLAGGRARGEGTEKPRPISAGRGQNVILALNCSLRGELAIAEKMPKVAESILVPGAAK